MMSGNLQRAEKVSSKLRVIGMQQPEWSVRWTSSLPSAYLIDEPAKPAGETMGVVTYTQPDREIGKAGKLV